MRPNHFGVVFFPFSPSRFSESNELRREKIFSKDVNGQKCFKRLLAGKRSSSKKFDSSFSIRPVAK